MDKFEAFSIKSIPHIDTYDTYMLENAASNNDPTHNIFYIELIWNPLILHDNERIMDFLQSKDPFCRLQY